jgi:hypothetical protein
MRRLLLALPVLALLVGCPSTAAAPDTGDDAGEGGATLDGEADAVASTPTTEACTGATTACLSGTAAASGFTVQPARMKAELYREYPSSGATAMTSVPVALDGTWAFSGLPAWSHYFVQIVADFGQPVALSSVVGALTVPSTGAPPVAVRVQPVQLSVVQQSQVGAPQQLVSALAYVFDPSSGAPVSNATVSIVVGGTPEPMAYTAVAAGTYGYVLKAAASTPAQASYTVTTTLPGATASTWQLVAPTSTLTPVLSAPVTSTTVPAKQPLTVAWAAQPSDAELVTLYAQTEGVWNAVYQSPPDAADVLQQIVPGPQVTMGALLVNVQFLSGSCPATADGCVAGAVVAAAQVTAQ